LEKSSGVQSHFTILVIDYDECVRALLLRALIPQGVVGDVFCCLRLGLLLIMRQTPKRSARTRRKSGNCLFGLAEVMRLIMNDKNE
jgi:hypothetical protein